MNTILKIFLISFSLLLGNTIYAQHEQEIDSLYKFVYNSKNDTNKVSALIKICSIYAAINADSLYKYANHIGKVSENIQYNKGTAFSKYYLASYYNLEGNYQLSIETLKNALTYLSGSINDKLVGKIFGSLADIYANAGNYDSSFACYEKAIQLKESVKDSMGMMHSLIGFGELYVAMGNYTKAISCFSKVLSIASAKKDSAKIADSYLMFSRAYFFIGYHQLALDYGLKALSIISNKGKLQEEADCYFTLADIYREGFKDFDKAEDMALKAYHLYESTGNEGSSNSVLGTLSSIYIETQEYDKAELYAYKLLAYTTTYSDDENKALALLNLGTIYVEQSKYSDAIERLTQSINVSKSINNLGYLQIAYALLAKAYDQTRDYEQAYNYNVLSDELEDSLMSENNRQILLELNAKYESEKKDNELALQKANLGEQNARIEKQGILIYTTLSGLGLLAVIIVLIIMINKRNKLKIKSDEEKKRMVLQNNLLELEQKALRSQMNPHFIFNALNSIQAFITTNDADQASSLLAKFAKLMRLILDNSREKIIPLENEIKMLQYYLELQQLSYNNKFRFTIEADPQIQLEEIGIPPMLIQPFVENAIVHGIANKTENGIIILRIKQAGDYVQIEIEDDGVGREKALIQKKQLETIHKSVGLLITKERINIFNAEHQQHIKVDVLDLKDNNGNAVGTKGVLQFPLQQLYN